MRFSNTAAHHSLSLTDSEKTKSEIEEEEVEFFYDEEAGPDILRHIAKIALERGDYSLFANVLASEHLTPHALSMIVKDLSLDSRR